MTYLKCRCAHFPLNVPVYCQCFCHSATASSSQVVGTMAPTQMAPVTVPAVTEAGDEQCHRIFATSPCEFFGRQPQHQLHLQFRTEVAIFERFGGWLQSFSWTVFGSDRSAKPLHPKLANMWSNSGSRVWDSVSIFGDADFVHQAIFSVIQIFLKVQWFKFLKYSKFVKSHQSTLLFQKSLAAHVDSFCLWWTNPNHVHHITKSTCAVSKNCSPLKTWCSEMFDYLTGPRFLLLQ